MAEIREGDTAPEFTVPLANGEVESFTLSERLDEAPLVLAFFPGAFTGTCRREMRTFRDRMDEFAAADGTVYGVSVDSPFALNEFREKHDLGFGLLSDFGKDVVDDYGVRGDLARYGVYGVAQRAVFVVDDEGTVVYRWIAEEPGTEPDYDEVLDAVESAG
ncbi:peroxiredoxin [Halobacteriales archaeon QS_8_69_26]|nr:MAG: peroxiredoxin [Halobacteriales archaeon QS_8_69_26]